MIKYNLILIEADPTQNLGGSCLNDLRNFLNYTRLIVGCDNINMIYVLTNRELTNSQKSKFLIPLKKSSITFIHFSNEKNLIDVTNYFKQQSVPLLIYISGHGGQIKDTNGDEKDGMDEFIPLNNKQIITDDKLTQMIVDQTQTTICIVDTCNSGSMLDLNYQYDGEEFFINREQLIPETQTFYIGAATDGTYAYTSSSNQELGYGGAFTLKIIEQHLLNDFLINPTIENITKAYDGLEYFLREHSQTPTIQTNFMED